jgi:hypothetical protein
MYKGQQAVPSEICDFLSAFLSFPEETVFGIATLPEFAESYWRHPDVCFREGTLANSQTLTSKLIGM